LELEKAKKPITIKWDGFPAVVFGRDTSGKLVFVDKHQYEKVVKGKAKFSTIEEYDKERGANRSNLWNKEGAIRKALESVVPSLTNVYWMGDLMWTTKPAVKGEYHVFRPNTVEYQVKKNSELGKKIAGSTVGIAAHTYIPGLGKEDVPLEGLQGLDSTGPVVFLTGELKDQPKVVVDNREVQKAKAVVERYGAAADKFIDDISNMRAKLVLTSASQFITRMLEDNDIKNKIVPRFLDFLGEKLTPAAQEKLLGPNNNGWLYRQDGGGPGLVAIWNIWAALTELKLQIKKQIDVQVQGSEVKAFVSGAEGHEGYVVGQGADKLKLVDRLGFTAANFAKHRVSSEEVKSLERMPNAVFCFGRMNPPTRGHGLVMGTTVKVGGEHSYIFLSSSQNPATDPLDFETKIAFIKNFFNQLQHIVGLIGIFWN
jgi:hypothetical protein